MTDRRTRKTDRAIFDALQTLSETTPVARITVAALAREADITRKTFYDHFPTVTDAYQAMLDGIVDEVAAKTERDWQLCARAELALSPEREIETRLRLFLGNVRELIESQAAHSRRRNRHITQEEQLGYLAAPFTRCVRDGLLGDPARFADDIELVSEFVLVGMLWMYRRWMASNTPDPLADAQQHVCKLILHGLTATLDRA